MKIVSSIEYLRNKTTERAVNAMNFEDKLNSERERCNMLADFCQGLILRYSGRGEQLLRILEETYHRRGRELPLGINKDLTPIDLIGIIINESDLVEKLAYLHTLCDITGYNAGDVKNYRSWEGSARTKISRANRMWSGSESVTETIKCLTKYEEDGSDVNAARFKQSLESMFQYFDNETYTMLSWVYPMKYLPMDENVLGWLKAQKYLAAEAEEVTPHEYLKLMEMLKPNMMKTDGVASDCIELYLRIKQIWSDGEDWTTLRLQPETSDDSYSKTDFLSDVFMNSDKYNLILDALTRKKNIILQGPPGVGKTYAAKRLCYSILGAKKRNHVEFVQFHQNTSYESFVMGYRPDPKTNNFTMQLGSFFRFCKVAEKNQGEKYFFIIDEINRGNISKIFGELLMLIEADKRNEYITMTYSEEPFMIPGNLYIIGMMNTADKSLAIIDYALRRRFAFIDFLPNFDTPSFRRYQQVLNNRRFDKLVEVIEDLNKFICEDLILGEGFMIGHSYLCNCTNVTNDWLYSVIEYDIIPLLKEYWSDEKQKLNRWCEELRSVMQDVG